MDSFQAISKLIKSTKLTRLFTHFTKTYTIDFVKLNGRLMLFYFKTTHYCFINFALPNFPPEDCCRSKYIPGGNCETFNS